MKERLIEAMVDVMMVDAMMVDAMIDQVIHAKIDSMIDLVIHSIKPDHSCDHDRSFLRSLKIKHKLVCIINQIEQKKGRGPSYPAGKPSIEK